MLLGKKNCSPPSTIIEIVTNVQSEQNVVTSFHNDSKELEKSNHQYKESSSTQTSSSSSVLHKRKASSYASSNGVYRTLMANQMMTLNRPRRNEINSTTQRILSAKFLRVKQLQSELIEAHKKITDLQNENRTLKIIYRRQDSALRKYESQESYLPQLLKSHEEEMRVLTSKYKKIRGAYNDLESRYSRQFAELTFVRDRYNHLLQISQDKHLLERERLTKQIEEMKIVVNDLKNKIKLQSRRLDLEVKNCKYQLSVEFHKQKTLREELRKLQDAIEKMKHALEEKERYIAVCQMNHHVVNKTSHNTKLTNTTAITKSLKATRNRVSEGNIGQDEDDVNITKNEITALNKKGEKTEPSVASTNPIALLSADKKDNPLTVCSNVTTTTVPKIETILQTAQNCSVEYRDNRGHQEEKSIEIVDKADNNNNRKLNSLVDANSLTSLKAKRVLRKSLSLESFEECERTFIRDEESSSEKSNDFKHVEEAISWLEVHEKSSHNDIFERTVEDNSQDSQTSLFSSDFDNIVERTRNAISEVTRAVDTEPHSLTENSMPVEKKTALLRALETIDLGSKEIPPSLPGPVAIDKLCPSKNNVKLKRKVN